MLLEVIATTLDQAIQAEKMGAGRLELVMGISEGGLTPSYAMVEQIKKHVKIPLAVMIRPHSKSFVYSRNDVVLMKRDIELFNELGVDSFVMGALDAEGNIDMSVMRELLATAGETPVAFHRAFDDSQNYKRSLDDLNQMKQVVRLLTSFGADSSLPNRTELSELTALAKEKGLSLLWGGGVTDKNLKTILAQIQPSEVHVGSAVRLGLDAKADLDETRMNFFTRTLKDYSS